MGEAEAQWAAFQQVVQGPESRHFDGEGPVIGARAPGRLDVMGGVADYSGSIVLEATLSVATCAAVQRRTDRVLRIRSVGSAGRTRECEVPLDPLVRGGVAASYEDAHAYLTSNRENRWAAYVAGCLFVLLAEGRVDSRTVAGLNVLVDSGVPIGAGVSSSAALEVSAMTGICGLLEIDIDGMEIARLCQMVENRVVGAPCGIMDQVTCSLGRENALLALKCQPHEVLGFETIPPGWRFVGIDSAVKHSVGGRAYAKARIGAFMGLAFARQRTGSAFGGYLCNMDCDTWNSIREQIPVAIHGRDFMEKYGPLGDPVSTVLPDEEYRPRACAEHPITENDRVREFLSLMEVAQRSEDLSVMAEAGQLMLDAHRSYSERLDLGSPETDLLVELAMKEGSDKGVFGAKITGGGSGGTVAILCTKGSDEAIERIRAEYASRTGRSPALMTGSSSGAAEFGARRIG